MHRKLEGKYPILPYEFNYEALNLNFKVGVDHQRETFTLEVQNRRFESLPWRPFPIRLTSK